MLVVRALPASAAATYDDLGRDLDAAWQRVAPAHTAAGGAP